MESLCLKEAIERLPIQSTVNCRCVGAELLLLLSRQWLYWLLWTVDSPSQFSNVIWALWPAVCEHIPWIHSHLTSAVSSVNLWELAFSSGLMMGNPPLPPCLHSVSLSLCLIWEWGRGLGSSISGHHLKLGTQTFYDCWAKWIWDSGNSPYLSNRQPHFLAPCSLLPHSHWLPAMEVPIFQRQTGAPTLLGLNGLDFPHRNVVSDTSFFNCAAALLKACSVSALMNSGRRTCGFCVATVRNIKEQINFILGILCGIWEKYR